MLNEIDLSRTDLNLLVLFDTVYRKGNVGRAAEALNLSPSAVSHGLGRLRRLLNDPLFLKTPKGVVATARAESLRQPVAEILARIRAVIASAEPFDPATSSRRFLIGTPDSVGAVLLGPLLKTLARSAPGIDIGLRQVLPPPGRLTDNAWDFALAELETRAMDVAILPIAQAPARFHLRPLYVEDFVLVMRAGHPFATAPSLERYCEMQHLVVSQSGDAYGFVDHALAGVGRSRRVAVTVPIFMMAIAMVADTDLISAMPRSFLEAHREQYDVIGLDPPLTVPHFQMSLIALQSAMLDDGVAWLFERLAALFPPGSAAVKAPPPRRAR